MEKENMASASTPSSSGALPCKWTKEQTELLIKLRGQHEHLFTGAKHSAIMGWSTIIEKMGLQGKVEPQQAKKKWDNLKRQYKDCKYPGSGEGASGKPTAATWPWFLLMDEHLAHRTSINPPVLIASLPEDTPGPSTAAVGGEEAHEVHNDDDDDEEDAADAAQRPQPLPSQRRRKRKREDALLALIKEDMKQQKEADERRERESRERSDRLFSLLEKLVERDRP